MGSDCCSPGRAREDLRLSSCSSSAGVGLVVTCARLVTSAGVTVAKHRAVRVTAGKALRLAVAGQPEHRTARATPRQAGRPGS